MAMTAAPRPDLFFADRYGLTQSRLDALVGSAASRVDYADVFIEYQVAEELVIEDGVVKKASRTISQGGGIRAQAGRADGVRLHGRPGHPSPRGRGAAGAGHRRAPGGGRPGRGPLEPATPRSLQSRPRARGSGPQREGGPARPGGPDGACPGPSRAPGHRDARLSRADGADRDLRQLAAGGRAALDPTERDGGRRGRRPARGRELRGRRARGVRLLHRGRALGPVREGGGAPGPREAGRGRRAGGDDDGRAGTGMAGHPAPRGDRPRPRGRLQPEGRVRVHGARRRACRLRSRHRRGRRDHPQPPGLAQRRRRGDAHEPHGTHRERGAARVHAGPAQRAAPRNGIDRQRPARVVPAPADAAHDEHVHAGRRGGARGHRALRSPTGSTPSRSAAGRWTSPAGSSCSRRARPT